MELRRAANVLLRIQGAPLSAVVNPRSTIRWSTKMQLEYRNCSNRPTQRCISTSPRRHAFKNIPTTTSASPRPANPLPSTETSSTQSSPTPSKPTSTIDDLSATLGAGLGWPSQGNKRNLPRPRATGQFERTLNGGSSASDLLQSLSQKQRGRARGAGQVQFERMLDPVNPNASPDVQSFMLDTAEQTKVPKVKRLPMNLGPSAGRSVTVGAQGVDPARGFRLLEQACARNKVRSDQTKQRFHERGGLMRKRLVRERWRKRFMAGFKATISRVKALKNQGW